MSEETKLTETFEEKEASEEAHTDSEKNNNEKILKEEQLQKKKTDKENKEEKVEQIEPDFLTKFDEEEEYISSSEDGINEYDDKESNVEDWAPVIPDLEEKKISLDDDSSIMTLEKLPTWGEEGPEIVKENPPPKFTPEFQANTEINNKISFWMRGNSAKLAADAVVNAANSHLLPGGGICGVLHSAAGHKMADECYSIGYTPTGKCAVTQGYKLPAKYCIHTVGPIGEDPAKLKQAYESTLACIDGKKIRSIGFCCISTGIYGYPIKPATKIALETIRKFLEDTENREKTDRIIFVVFEKRDVAVYNYLRHIYFPLEVDYRLDDEESENDSLKSNSQQTESIEESKSTEDENE